MKKRYLRIFQCIILCFSLVFSCIEQGFNQDMEAQLPFAGEEGMPSEEEFIEFLNNLTPEDIAMLEQLGQEIIDELEKEGIDPIEFLLGDMQEEQEDEDIEEPSDVIPTKPVEEIIDEKKPVLINETEAIENAKKLLSNLIEKLNSVKLKAETKESIRSKLQPWSYHIADTIYFLSVIKQDHLIPYLVSDKFKELYAHLEILESVLNEYEPLFNVRGISIDESDPYIELNVSSFASLEEVDEAYKELSREKNPFKIREQLTTKELTDEELTQAVKDAEEEFTRINEAYKQIHAREISKNAFEMIINALATAIHEHKILEQLKSVLKAYDPEALALKEKQEQKEARARAEHARLAQQRPYYTPPVFKRQPFDYGYQPDDYSGDYSTQPYTPSDSISPEEEKKRPSLDQKAKAQAQEKDKKKKDKKKDKKDKKDKKEKDKEKDKKKIDPHAQRLTGKVIGAIQNLEAFLKNTFRSFVSFENYLTDPFDAEQIALEKKNAQDFIALFMTLEKNIQNISRLITQDLDSKYLKENKKAKSDYIDELLTAFKKLHESDIKKKTLDFILMLTEENSIIQKNFKPLKVSEEKKYVFFGINPTHTINEEIEALNKGRINYIKSIQQDYFNVQKLVDKVGMMLSNIDKKIQRLNFILEHNEDTLKKFDQYLEKPFDANQSEDEQKIAKEFLDILHQLFSQLNDINQQIKKDLKNEYLKGKDNISHKKDYLKRLNKVFKKFNTSDLFKNTFKFITSLSHEKQIIKSDDKRLNVGKDKKFIYFGIKDPAIDLESNVEQLNLDRRNIIEDITAAYNEIKESLKTKVEEKKEEETDKNNGVPSSETKEPSETK